MGPAQQEVAGKDLVEALVKLGLNESNKSGRHVFTSHLLLRWTHITPLIRTLTTGHLTQALLSCREVSAPAYPLPSLNNGQCPRPSRSWHQRSKEGTHTHAQCRWRYKISHHFFTSKSDQGSDFDSQWSRQKKRLAHQFHKHTTDAHSV